jgi:hypothetical protein
MRKLQLFSGLLALSIAVLACGGGTSVQSDPAQAEQIIPTPTAIPIPTPPQTIPSTLPDDDELRALIIYANEMSPIIVAAGEILERDGEILKQSEQDDQVLCDGRLSADNQVFSAYLEQVKAIDPPTDADAIHTLVIESGDAWSEAIVKIDEFCSTGNGLHKIPAAIKFWEAAWKIQDAGNRFWLLMMSEGVEAWVRR